MSYARVNWNSTTTYVSAENLNVMDKGIKDCDDAIVALSGKVGAVGSIDLQTQINSVNNNLMTESTKDFVVSDFSVAISSIDNCYAQRKGKYINLRLTFNASALISSLTNIITLPELYRPSRKVKSIFASNDGVMNYVTIGTDGTVKADGNIASGTWTFIYLSY